MSLNVLIVDDHVLFCDGLKGVLHQCYTNIQTAEATCVEQALQLEINPDLVLLDIHLKGISGIHGMHLFTQKWPEAKILLMSGAPEFWRAMHFIPNNVLGFIDKSQTSQAMLETLQTVTGGMLVPIATTLNTTVDMGAALDPFEAKKAEADEDLAFTDKQIKILVMINQGLSNKVIGQKLHLSEHTVRWYLQKIMYVLKASSRSEAVFKARQQGLIE